MRQHQAISHKVIKVLPIYMVAAIILHILPFAALLILNAIKVGGYTNEIGWGSFVYLIGVIFILALYLKDVRYNIRISAKYHQITIIWLYIIVLIAGSYVNIFLNRFSIGFLYQINTVLVLVSLVVISQTSKSVVKIVVFMCSFLVLFESESRRYLMLLIGGVLIKNTLDGQNKIVASAFVIVLVVVLFACIGVMRTFDDWGSFSADMDASLILKSILIYSGEATPLYLIDWQVKNEQILNLNFDVFFNAALQLLKLGRTDYLSYVIEPFSYMGEIAWSLGVAPSLYSEAIFSFGLFGSIFYIMILLWGFRAYAIMLGRLSSYNQGVMCFLVMWGYYYFFSRGYLYQALHDMIAIFLTVAIISILRRSSGESVGLCPLPKRV